MPTPAATAVATRVFTDSAGHAAVLEATHTFSAMDLGTATSDRIIVIAGGSGGLGISVSSVTVGGDSCTEATEALASTSGAWIWYVALSSGATGDVVVTFASSEYRSYVGVYALYGASGGPTNTATATGAEPISASLVKKGGGVSFGTAFQTNFDAGTQTHDWTNLTEDLEISGDASGGGSVASEEVGADATQTVTCDSSSTDTRFSLAMASWPAA